MVIPDMVDEVHAKFGWITLLVNGETLPAKGVLEKDGDIHALCHKIADGRPVLNLNRSFFEFETVVFPRSEFMVKDTDGCDITDVFLAFTKTLENK